MAQLTVVKICPEMALCQSYFDSFLRKKSSKNADQGRCIQMSNLTGQPLNHNSSEH